MYGVTSGIEAAAETAAKLEATLNVKKKPDASELPKAFFKNTDVLKIIQAEYCINHCTHAVRNLLCKGATQEKIREHCEAYVSTKGRYIPEGSQVPAEKTDKAFGLYLFIRGPNKRSVDLAIAMIEGIIATGDTRPPALMSLNTAAPPPGTAVVPQPQPQPNIQTMPPPHLQTMVQMQVPPPTINLVEKVPIGIDRPLPGFNLPMKLIGQNGSNLQYIRNETGAVVTLRGIGSAFIEPATGQEAQEVLHFSIEHSKPEGLATARELALNLIATVQQEYAQVQASQAGSVQPMMDPNLLVHQPPLEQPMMHQPVLATSISLPVVQTAGGFLQQPPVTTVPPPQFSHPPPPQLSLPPPGIHIPPQQGPLVPPPGHPPQQLQMQHGEQPGGMVQQQLQPGPPPQQQQYLITQSGQPVQGIMTSQGFVVLNQQPQQVFLSQPPGQAPQVLHQGQLAFQPAAPSTVSAPVSYQLQYVQQNQSPLLSGSPIHLQQQQPHQQQQQQHVVLQPPGQVQFQNGTVHIAQHQVMGVKPGESGQVQQHIMQQGHVMQVKQIPQTQTVQLMQPYAPTVQYMSSPGVRPEQAGPVVQKEPRLGKRKFTEEAEPQTSPQQSPQQAQSSPQQPSMQPQQQSQPQMMQMQNQHQQHQMMHAQQMLQPPPQHPQQQQQMPGPQPVPHPSQTMSSGHQLVRQGVGLQDMRELEREEQASTGSGEAPQTGKGEGGVDQTPPPPPGPGNGQFLGQQQPPLEQHKIPPQNQWFEIDQNQKGRIQTQQQQPSPNDFGYNNVFTRRERPQRDRPTFNHYSSKPQMYAYQSYMQSGICPPPPPPPPPMQQQQQQQPQQHYYYHRR